MPWKPHRTHLNRLTEFRAAYRFKIRKTGRDDPGTIVCTLSDSILGGDFAEGTGSSEEEAFIAAMSHIETKDRPRTPVELARENKELQAELARLKGEMGDVKAPPAPPPNKPPTVTTAEDGEPQPPPRPSDFESKVDVRAFLESKDVEHDGRASKDDLIARGIEAGVISVD
jgi:hypothetical protein